MPVADEVWGIVGAKDYQRLMTTPKAAKSLARWFNNSDLLAQFALAKVQLN